MLLQKARHEDDVKTLTKVGLTYAKQFSNPSFHEVGLKTLVQFNLIYIVHILFCTLYFVEPLNTQLYISN